MNKVKENTDKMDYRLLADTAVLAGEIMLENGAETYVVEETIKKMINTGNLKHTEVVVMITSIITTISNPDITPITVLRRIERRQTNLNRVYLVEDIVKKYCIGKLSLQSTLKRLKIINRYKQYGPIVTDLSTIFIPPPFTIMLGGSYKDAIASIICGVVLMVSGKLKNIIKNNNFLIYAVSSMLISIVAAMINTVLKTNIDLVIISTIMPLVPGIALTNSVRDIINGDYVSGQARLLEALTQAAATAVGIGFGIFICRRMFGGITI